MNWSVPSSPPLITAAATRIETISPSIAQNSVVLKAAFVSVTPVPTVLDLTPVLGGLTVGAAVPSEVVDLVREHVEPEGDIHASAEYRRMLAAELTRRVLATTVDDHEEGAA